MKFHNTSGKSAAPQQPAHNSELPTAHGNVQSKDTASWAAVPSDGSHPKLAQPHGPLPHPGKGKSQLEFTYVNSPPIPIEPLVTKKTLADHYGLSVRTVNYAMTLGLPKVQVGGRVRFRFSEVQPWFEQNGCRRFAAEGIKMAIQKSVAKQFHLNLSDQVQITSPNRNLQPSPKKQSA
jgi:hypothetical protein